MSIKRLITAGAVTMMLLFPAGQAAFAIGGAEQMAAAERVYQQQAQDGYEGVAEGYQATVDVAEVLKAACEAVVEVASEGAGPVIEGVADVILATEDAANGD